MKLPIVQIDAFTDHPFKGNPAAVVWLDNWLDDTLMLNITREMNLSETAFVKQNDDQTTYDLRWFTPGFEVDLCGHATLATAHYLRESQNWTGHSPITFHTRSGELHVDFQNDIYIMDFPADQPVAINAADSPPIIAALNLDPSTVKNIYRGKDDIMVILDESKLNDIMQVQPDFQQLNQIDTRGVIISHPVTNNSPDSNAQHPWQNCDFVSRFFAPRCGINEDPVTGSAHCLLTPYYAQTLQQNELTAYQASPRGGHLKLTLKQHRVKLAGQATTTLTGTLQF